MFSVPDSFRHRPFARAEALAAGISRFVLEGPQFVRVHHGVYRFHEHQLSFDDRIAAATLALPARARTTGSTRLRQAGLHVGDDQVRFVLQGDHHLELEGVFLHRTVLMPPVDESGVTIAAAFIAYCAEARVVDAIKAGSWLSHHELLDGEEFERIIATQPWRRGCREAAYIHEHIDARCRSLPEAELLTLLRAVGLPEPEVNHRLELDAWTFMIADLWYPRWRRAVEYEGVQHQEDREQYSRDIDRYEAYRRLGADYVQVTKERMRNPRAVVGRVYRSLVEGGYDGPTPDFGADWNNLFAPLTTVAGVRAVS